MFRCTLFNMVHITFLFCCLLVYFFFFACRPICYFPNVEILISYLEVPGTKVSCCWFFTPEFARKKKGKVALPSCIFSHYSEVHVLSTSSDFFREEAFRVILFIGWSMVCVWLGTIAALGRQPVAPSCGFHDPTPWALVHLATVPLPGHGRRFLS